MEVSPDQAEPPECREQSDPGDRGRQHERQLDERQHSGPTREAPAGQQVRDWSPDEKD